MSRREWQVNTNKRKSPTQYTFTLVQNKQKENLSTYSFKHYCFKMVSSKPNIISSFTK